MYLAMDYDYNENIQHSGTKGHSGRYPLGSGKEPNQRLKREGKIPWGESWKMKKTEKRIQKESAKKQQQKAKEEKKRFRSTQDMINEAARNKATKMSNDELQEKINRLKLEKEYRTLISEITPKTESRGKRFMKDIGMKIAKDTLEDVGTQVAKYALGEGINYVTGKPIYKRKDGGGGGDKTKKK